MKIKKLSKAVWVGAIIGGVYALIPFISFVLREYSLYKTIFFFPTKITLYIMMPFSILLYFNEILNENTFEIFIRVINIPLWILLGSLVGRLIGRIKNKGNTKKI